MAISPKWAKGRDVYSMYNGHCIRFLQRKSCQGRMKRAQTISHYMICGVCGVYVPEMVDSKILLFFSFQDNNGAEMSPK